MKKSKKLLLTLSALVFSAGLSAQNLVVLLTNATTETFPVSGIQSIKFGASSMILNETDGTVTTWNIANINNYSFSETSGLSDDLSIESSHLNIFPNPSSSSVNLVFSTTHSTNVTIDIVDASGKIIEQIYEGEHQGNQTYVWNGHVKKGIYYGRIITAHKIITKPIVTQ